MVHYVWDTHDSHMTLPRVDCCGVVGFFFFAVICFLISGKLPTLTGAFPVYEKYSWSFFTVWSFWWNATISGYFSRTYPIILISFSWSCSISHLWESSVHVFRGYWNREAERVLPKQLLWLIAEDIHTLSAKHNVQITLCYFSSGLSELILCFPPRSKPIC